MKKFEEKEDSLEREHSCKFNFKANSDINSIRNFDGIFIKQESNSNNKISELDMEDKPGDFSSEDGLSYAFINKNEKKGKYPFNLAFNVDGNLSSEHEDDLCNTTKDNINNSNKDQKDKYSYIYEKEHIKNHNKSNTDFPQSSKKFHTLSLNANHESKDNESKFSLDSIVASVNPTGSNLARLESNSGVDMKDITNTEDIRDFYKHLHESLIKIKKVVPVTGEDLDSKKIDYYLDKTKCKTLYLLVDSKVVVLDLDETLIHCNKKNINNSDKILTVILDTGEQIKVKFIIIF